MLDYYLDDHVSVVVTPDERGERTIKLNKLVSSQLGKYFRRTTFKQSLTTTESDVDIDTRSTYALTVRIFYSVQTIIHQCIQIELNDYLLGDYGM